VCIQLIDYAVDLQIFLYFKRKCRAENEFAKNIQTGLSYVDDGAWQASSSASRRASNGFAALSVATKRDCVITSPATGLSVDLLLSPSCLPHQLSGAIDRVVINKLISSEKRRGKKNLLIDETDPRSFRLESFSSRARLSTCSECSRAK
jgi:hypothetical protein